MMASTTTAIAEVSRGPSYYRARYYNPATGRFLSEDPAGFKGGINRYAYVGDSPENFVDPLGLDKVKCASQFGKDHSVASMLGMGDSYAANLFLGNSVSGLADLGESVFGNGGPPDFAKMALRGASQGIPINDILAFAGEERIPGLNSITGSTRSVVLKSIFDAATESGSIPSIATEGGEIAAQGGLSTGEFASGIGIAKFAYDALSFGYGYFVACSQ
jgi:RHS repeat-associated protein